MLCIKFDRIEYKLSEQFELVAAVGESTRVRLVSQAEIQTPLGYLYMLQFNLRTVAATDHNKIQTSEMKNRHRGRGKWVHLRYLDTEIAKFGWFKVLYFLACEWLV